MSILAVLQVAQAYSGPHNVMSPLPSRMLVDGRYTTMACQQRLVHPPKKNLAPNVEIFFHHEEFFHCVLLELALHLHFATLYNIGT